MRISDWSSDVCSSDLVLALAAIFAAPHLADQMIGQVVEIFFAAARDDFDQSAMDAGFLAEFADRRFLGLLAIVDSALRHLPGFARGIEPLADEDAAVEIGRASCRERVCQYV